jgi:phosphoenolpyruvate carboxykinase (ATP)
MSIKHTRALLSAALDGGLARCRFRADPIFGLMVPERVPGIPSEVLDPRRCWRDPKAYDKAARDLAARFEKNFENFAGAVGEDVKAAAIRAAA